MKKFVVLIILISSFLPIFNLRSAQAAIFNDSKKIEFYQTVNEVAPSDTAQYRNASLESVISNIIKLILGVLGTIFIVLMFVAGNNWMQAAGNEEKIKKSKATIQNLLIGLCLIMVAYALASGLGGLLAKIMVAK